MTTDRAYRPALAAESALKEMEANPGMKPALPKNRPPRRTQAMA